MIHLDTDAIKRLRVLLWKKQRRRHPGKTIINICDNDPYYHSKHRKYWLAQNPWCKLIYLPPYAPNLNLIERLWKFLNLVQFL